MFYEQEPHQRVPLAFSRLHVVHAASQERKKDAPSAQQPGEEREKLSERERMRQKERTRENEPQFNIISHLAPADFVPIKFAHCSLLLWRLPTSKTEMHSPL